MKHFLNRFPLGWALPFVCGFFLANCQFSGHPGAGKASGVPNKSAQQGLVGGGGEWQGTGDGGGANGAGGRVLESYIVDPTQLDAFKEHLSTLFKDPQPADSENGGWTSKSYFKLKTWYIAPVKLKPLSNDSLGLSFAANQTQQLAIQNTKAIWIDQDYFNKMSSEEQAQLLLHEIVMNIYFLKFKKMSELCRDSEKIKDSKHSKPCSSEFDEFLPPSPVAPLNLEDYENIRKVTAWLWRHRRENIDGEITTQLFLNGFDPRIFNSNGNEKDEAQNDSKPVSATVVTDLIDSALLLNAAPSECLGVQLNEKIPCALHLQEAALPYGTTTLQGYKVQLQASSTNSILDEVFFPNAFQVYPFLLNDPATTEAFVGYPVSGMPVHNPVKGTKFRMSFFIAKKIATGIGTKMKLYAWISIPMVITKIERNASGVTCSGDRANPASINDDTLIASAPGVNTKYLQWFSKAQVSSSIPCY